MLEAIYNPSFTCIIACFVSVAAAKGINYKQPFFSCRFARNSLVSFENCFVLNQFLVFWVGRRSFQVSQEGETSVKFAIAFYTLIVELAGFYLYLKLLLKLTILNKRDYILDDCFESSLPRM